MQGCFLSFLRLSIKQITTTINNQALLPAMVYLILNGFRNYLSRDGFFSWNVLGMLDFLFMSNKASGYGCILRNTFITKLSKEFIDFVIKRGCGHSIPFGGHGLSGDFVDRTVIGNRSKRNNQFLQFDCKSHPDAI